MHDQNLHRVITDALESWGDYGYGGWVSGLDDAAPDTIAGYLTPIIEEYYNGQH